MTAEPAARLSRALATRLDERAGAIAPAHAWGAFDGAALIARGGAADAAFRIASCTKSFTAAAALLLESEGALGLDEPLADALDVPLRLIGPGGAAPTVRDALAMRAGFPTDDPWGDRQEPLSDEEFGRLLSEGVRTMWPAGARYEYSNLGYAIAGRIIGLRAGMPYRRVVESRLLEPLGLAGTGFERTDAAIVGHRRGPDGWEPLPFSGPGAFSPIGGLFSTVADLARWCGVLAGAVDAGRALPPGLAERMRHPLTPIAGDPSGDGPWQAYGLGLMLRADAAGRRFAGHSGGYPGFSARMEWETSSRIGAVAFENAGYTGVTLPVHAALDEAFPAPDAVAPALAPPPFEVWPETADAAARTRAALAAGSLPEGALLDPCVALDQPLPRRAAALADLVASIGGVTSLSPVEHATPARASWELRGPRGTLRCGILLTPRAEPRIQRLDVVPVAPSPHPAG